MKKLVIFTDNKCKFNIVWNIRNIRSLFQTKDNAKHYSCVICVRNFSCGENYVGEAVRNVVLSILTVKKHPKVKLQRSRKV